MLTNRYCIKDIKELLKGGVVAVKRWYGPHDIPNHTILSLVKASLSLAHGNAEMNRGFSDSGKTVTVDRTRLSEASIKNLGIATDGLKVLGSPPHHVPIPPSCIKFGQSAHKNYRLRVEEER